MRVRGAKEANSLQIRRSGGFNLVRVFTPDRQMSMRCIVCLITILLSGCQAVPQLDRPTENSLIPIMPLWERYQQCLASTSPEELVLVIAQFERATLIDAEPPSWMRALGHHVMSKPTRVAVDPKALGAACTLRAAALLVKAERLTEARVLYQRILARYPSSEWAYYVDQAKEGLAKLSTSAPAVLAFHTDRVVPH